MSENKSTKSEKSTGKKTESATSEDGLVRVRVLAHRTRWHGAQLAKGSTQTMPLRDAGQLAEMGKVEVIGI